MMLNETTGHENRAETNNQIIFNADDRVTHWFSGDGVVLSSDQRSTKVAYDNGSTGTGFTYDYERI